MTTTKKHRCPTGSTLGFRIGGRLGGRTTANRPEKGGPEPACARRIRGKAFASQMTGIRASQGTVCVELDERGRSRNETVCS